MTVYLQAERCVVDLDVPHFHHEIVYEAVFLALEDGSESTMNSITELLKHFYDATMITMDQMVAVSSLPAGKLLLKVRKITLEKRIILLCRLSN